MPQPVYGGALRVFATRRRYGRTRVRAMLRASVRRGSTGPMAARPAARGASSGHGARSSPTSQARGRPARLVVGYGAPARAITFLNALGIGPELLPYVVDRAAAKQGRLIPGVRIPIRSPDALEQDRPDEVLILTWNLADGGRRGPSHRSSAPGRGFSSPCRGSLTSAHRILAERWLPAACRRAIMASCPIPTTTEID